MSSPSPASPAQLEAGISGTLSGTISLRSWFKPSDDMVSSIGNSGHRRKRSGAESLGNTPLGTGIRKGRQAARRGELVSKSTFLRAKKNPNHRSGWGNTLTTSMWLRVNQVPGSKPLPNPDYLRQHSPVWAMPERML